MRRPSRPPTVSYSLDSIRDRRRRSSSSDSFVLPQTVDQFRQQQAQARPPPQPLSPSSSTSSPIPNTPTRRRRKSSRSTYHYCSGACCFTCFEDVRKSSRFRGSTLRPRRTLIVACTTFVSFLLSTYYRADFHAVVQRFEATFFSSDGAAAGQRHGRYLESIVSPNDFSIVFSTRPAIDQTAYDGNSTTPSPPTHTKFVMPPISLDEDSILDAMQRDDGGLFIFIPEDETLRLQPRTIFHDFEEDQVYQNLINGPNDDDWIDNYYAFDDDANRNPYMAYEDADFHKDKQCRRTKWHRDLPIDCNKMHEFDTETRFRSGDTSFLGVGAYREAYISNLPHETVVFKAFYWGAEFSFEDYEYMRMDAIVSEKLTSNPLIVDIYGFCGTSMINEALTNGVLQKLVIPNRVGRLGHALDPTAELEVRNTLSVSEKLSFSLQMGEAVRVLHSYPEGIMVHDDIQLSQFLLADDGTLKLNDFNRAEIMLWNDKDQEYCRYRNNPGHGDWRSPEEYHDFPLDEKIDIWSLGNNMYALLTGLFPCYEEPDDKSVQARLMANQTAFIDPRYRNRSFAESKLVEIIEQCWTFDPNERIDIFELVELLRNLVQENNAREAQALKMRNSLLTPHISVAPAR